MKIDRLLAEHQLLVTTAESCTGGLVASALVDIPGISDYFKEGYITYAPEAKEKILGVLPETISDVGITFIRNLSFNKRIQNRTFHGFILVKNHFFLKFHDVCLPFLFLFLQIGRASCRERV